MAALLRGCESPLSAGGYPRKARAGGGRSGEDEGTKPRARNEPGRSFLTGAAQGGAPSEARNERAQPGSTSPRPGSEATRARAQCDTALSEGKECCDAVPRWCLFAGDSLAGG